MDYSIGAFAAVVLLPFSSSFLIHSSSRRRMAHSRSERPSGSAMWSEPDNVRLFPNIQWLPSRSATPREEHMPFYNRIWPKNDPFWQTNQPGNLWNCKCDWEETDDDPTSDNPTGKTAKAGLDQNPATSGQIFTDTAPYIKSAPEGSEYFCRAACRDNTKVLAENNKGITCNIGGTRYSVDFSNRKINNHFAKELFSEDIYWLKNEILTNPQQYFNHADYSGFKESDTTHNTNRETLRLKSKTDYFYYLKVSLPGKKHLYLHVGHYKDSDVLYLYSASLQTPKDMKKPQ